MKRIFFLALTLTLLAACRPQTTAVTILDGGQMYSLAASGGTPAGWLFQAGQTLGPHDRLLHLGLPVDPEQPLACPAVCSLQIRRAVTLTLVTPQGTRPIQTAAFTVGQALSEAGIELFAADRLDPPAETPLDAPLTVAFTPARPVTVQIGGHSLFIRSAAETAGAALAGAGIPLQGLDESIPAESETLPGDGNIRLVRVHEAMLLTQESIPFKSEFQAVTTLPLDQQEIIEPGEPGLALSRVRIRYADGQEAARQTEAETVVRPPKKQIVGYGTQVVLKTVETPAGPVEYWRAVPMYATSYSPCRSSPDRCYPNTASGKPVTKGVVAMTYDMYLALRGQRLYIVGYGFATIEDVGGGIPGRLWIDLGYSDADYVGWGETVMVYFLAPAPASVPFVLQ